MQLKKLYLSERKVLALENRDDYQVRYVSKGHMQVELAVLIERTKKHSEVLCNFLAPQVGLVNATEEVVFVGAESAST